MRLAPLALLCCATACTGCSDNPTTPDARVDAAIDGDPGPCDSGQHFVTGELVDLDSTAGQFLGVFNARLTAEGTPPRTATTAPNGRFELCAPAAPPITLDVDAPGDYLDGKMYLEAMEPDARPLSFRAFSAARASMLYAFDPTRAHVLVYLAGDRSDLSLDRPHAPPLAGSDDGTPGTVTWAAGTSGRYVLFPNVDASSPTATLGGDLSGPHTIPVAAGQLTLVAISFFFL
ncbi:MAG TPA: hypothetical protein VK932_19350 [Kofleriaceae bacterium]|nr:hypothetical protein [Kofleriaceae bacterium]